MLPKFYRTIFVNNSGRALTGASGAEVIASISPSKLVSGVLDYGSTLQELFGIIQDTSGTIADGAYVVGASIDNTSNLRWWAKGTLKVVSDDAAASGSYSLYYEFSDQDGGFPSDMDDFVLIENATFLATIKVEADAVNDERSVNFKIPD
jgi:hypothetical protein